MESTATKEFLNWCKTHQTQLLMEHVECIKSSLQRYSSRNLAACIKFNLADFPLIFFFTNQFFNFRFDRYRFSGSASSVQKFLTRKFTSFFFFLKPEEFTHINLFGSANVFINMHFQHSFASIHVSARHLHGQTLPVQCTRTFIRLKQYLPWHNFTAKYLLILITAIASFYLAFVAVTKHVTCLEMNFFN
jgi:hypothetical protein